MKRCPNCNNHVSNYALIEGKTRNISKRKYCLTCSPWNKHNTKKIHIIGTGAITRDLTCQACNKVYFYKRGGNGSHTKCPSCVVNGKRHAKKEKAVDYKGGKCQLCSYNKCMSSLIFHHLDPSQKDFNIGGAHCRSWETMKKELDKCILLCHNCHGEVHTGLVII